MALAMTGLLNSTKAAELIRDTTGRSCSRQNLEALCRKRRLPRSCVSLSPIRLKAEGLVEEYLLSVDQRQSIRDEPGIAQSILDLAPESIPMRNTAEDELPPYTESQARKAYEQANLLELERKQKERLLVARKDVELTWATVITMSKTKILGVPSRVKQRIPHLSLEEIDILSSIIREALQEIADQAEEAANE